MNLAELEQMKKVDVHTLNPDDVVDISTIKINIGKPRNEKIADDLKQRRNPYFHKVGEMLVKCSYPSNGVPIEDCFISAAKKFS